VDDENAKELDQVVEKSEKQSAECKGKKEDDCNNDVACHWETSIWKTGLFSAHYCADKSGYQTTKAEIVKEEKCSQDEADNALKEALKQEKNMKKAKEIAVKSIKAAKTTPSVDTESVDTESVDTESVDTESVDTEPTNTPQEDPCANLKKEECKKNPACEFNKKDNKCSKQECYGVTKEECAKLKNCEYKENKCQKLSAAWQLSAIVPLFMLFTFY
jgi:hypothetical protein